MNGVPRKAPRRTALAAEEREWRLAREAIAMVASGASPRVVVAGLHHAAEILVRARRLALEQGVRVNTLAACDGTRDDLVIEPIRK